MVPRSLLRVSGRSSRGEGSPAGAANRQTGQLGQPIGPTRLAQGHGEARFRAAIHPGHGLSGCLSGTSPCRAPTHPAIPFSVGYRRWIGHLCLLALRPFPGTESHRSRKAAGGYDLRSSHRGPRIQRPRSGGRGRHALPTVAPRTRSPPLLQCAARLGHPHRPRTPSSIVRSLALWRATAHPRRLPQP